MWTKGNNEKQVAQNVTDALVLDVEREDVLTKDIFKKEGGRKGAANQHELETDSLSHTCSIH